MDYTTEDCLNKCILFMFPTGEENLLAILKRRWWKYMILGLIDIEANYLVIKAYQYTTLASVQVYQCVYESVFVKERKERFSNSQCPKKQSAVAWGFLLGLSDWRLNLGCLLHITLCLLIFITALLVLKEPYSCHC